MIHAGLFLISRQLIDSECSAVVVFLLIPFYSDKFIFETSSWAGYLGGNVGNLRKVIMIVVPRSESTLFIIIWDHHHYYCSASIYFVCSVRGSVPDAVGKDKVNETRFLSSVELHFFL